MTLRIPASSIRHRKEFHLANKSDNETVENWYNRLKGLVGLCEYGPYTDAFLLNQFVCGLDIFILEDLYAEQRDLSLDDVIHLIKRYESNHQQPDVKPVLLNIKQEDQASSDGEQYADHAFSDSDGEEYNAMNEGKIEPAMHEKESNDETKIEENIHAFVPFMAETILEQSSTSNTPKLFECYLCHKTWKTAGNLTYHFISYHTIGKTSKCHLCGKWIKDASNMVRHLNVHFSTKQYLCNICDFSFARSTSLKNHLLSHNQPNQKAFHCSSCSKTFISKKHLKIHKLTHNQPEATLSEKLDEIAKLRKSKKIALKSGAKDGFKCELCSIIFPTAISLSNHEKLHNTTEWLCHLCGKKLMNKRNLIHHYRTHTNEKPFVCSDCGRAFTSKEKLKLHSKTHSGTRAHLCTQCNKTFIQKGHLAKHMKVHFPDSRFECTLCTRKFVDEEKLKRHIQMHAGVYSLECRYCQKPFKSNSHRTEHERTHTGEKPYQCTLCPKSFAQRATLRSHLKWHQKPKVERPDRPKKRKKKTTPTVAAGAVETSLLHHNTLAYLG